MVQARYSFGKFHDFKLEEGTLTLTRDYIADHYWPQGKSKAKKEGKEGTRVTGEALQKMYRKMEEKESKPVTGTPDARDVKDRPTEEKEREGQTSVVKNEAPAVAAPTVSSTIAADGDDEKEDGEI